MTSTNQITANRRNAQDSSGPRNAAGKARSSRNALKHGLTAKQVVIFGEHPADFEALRDDLYAYFQPTDPVEEGLVEQVATCRWRLRRVPEIEAGIFEYQYYRHQEEREHNAQFQVFDSKEEQRARKRQDEQRPALGHLFSNAERSLSSLARIAATTEGSMYRAIRELERRVAERQDGLDSEAVIDVEADEVEPSKPRLIES